MGRRRAHITIWLFRLALSAISTLQDTSHCLSADRVPRHRDSRAGADSRSDPSARAYGAAYGNACAHGPANGDACRNRRTHGHRTSHGYADANGYANAQAYGCANFHSRADGVQNAATNSKANNYNAFPLHRW